MLKWRLPRTFRLWKALGEYWDLDRPSWLTPWPMDPLMVMNLLKRSLVEDSGGCCWYCKSKSLSGKGLSCGILENLRSV